jgi:hypothetical protein
MSNAEAFAHRVAGFGWLLGALVIVTAAISG